MGVWSVGKVSLKRCFSVQRKVFFRACLKLEAALIFVNNSYLNKNIPEYLTTKFSMLNRNIRDTIYFIPTSINTTALHRLAYTTKRKTFSLSEYCRASSLNTFQSHVQSQQESRSREAEDFFARSGF